MSGTVVLVHLAGAVALLLWATRMVRTGVERAYGEILRRKLRSLLANPLAAAAAGTALAVAFQSSTAVALLVGAFVGSGMVGSASGLIAALGADLGSSFVVKLLSFDLSMLIPVAILVGTSIFLATERRAWRQFGRILVGIGLLLLSLQMIGNASEPLRESSILPIIIEYLSDDYVTAFLIAAVITWLFHSSVAFILLVVALASRHIVPGELGVVMVLGANLGGGLIAALLSRTMPVASRIVPLGNLVLRGIGALIGLALLTEFPLPRQLLGDSAPEQIVHAHIAFNAILVLAGMPLAGLVTRMLTSLLRSQTSLAGPPESRETSALDPSALNAPSHALANVTRAVVSVCDTIEVMLKMIMELYEAPDPERMQELAGLDDRVDRRHAAIKFYLARIPPEHMTEDEKQRTIELLEACVRLEQVGDIITRNMLAHVKKKMDRGLNFTPEGWRELSSLHATVLNNARLAFNVLITRDINTALELVREKDRMREIERDYSQRHFERLREGARKSIETSSLHLDTIRDLKQINSLLTWIAYPVLEEHGLLRESRLAVETEE